QDRCRGAPTRKQSSPIGVKIAEYLDKPAQPNARPAASQSTQSAALPRGGPNKISEMAQIAAVRHKKSGMSGTITPSGHAMKYGAELNANSAQSADFAPKSLRVKP